MKKLLFIFICFALIVASILPTVVFAADSADSDVKTEGIIYFLKPTAIAAVGNYLFVADYIEENRSVIVCFDITEEKAVYKYTEEVSGYVTNLSNKEDSGLYAILQDKILEYSIADGLSVVQTINVAGAVDVTYTDNISTKGEYVLTKSDLIGYGVGSYIDTLTNTKGCVSINGNIYYLYEENGYSVCRSHKGSDHSIPDNSLNKKDTPGSEGYYLADFKANGIFVRDSSTVALFDNNTIASIVIGSSTQNSQLDKIMQYDESHGSIKDVCKGQNRLYVLNSQNKIEIYSDEHPTFELLDTIGSDILKQSAPTVYTTFTLVRSKGYPSNIVFRTMGNNSIEEIETEASEYIVLGYDGEADSNFYYVLYGDKFGWVKKSDGAKSVDEDGKLEVVDTKVSDDTFEYKTKFNSLKDVVVAQLPRQFFYQSSDYAQTFTQSASNRIEATILQKFSEGDKVWYYVTFETNGGLHFGFVPQNAVGIYITTTSDDVPLKDYLKVNSTLFSAVKVYDNGNKKTMTDEHLAYTKQGDQIKLYSGKRVNVIDVKDGVAFIQVNYNGTYVYGYVFADQLIGVHQVTTNATVGLSLLAVAVALGVTLTIVFLKRRKRKAAGDKAQNQDAE